MNLSGFLSRNTRKAHRQISKALLDNQKIEFNDKFNETITESNIATDSQILNTLRKMVNDSISITENLLNNKKENVLKAILGPKGAAAQLSKSIYTSGSSNFKKISKQFAKINYDNNNNLINDNQIKKLTNNLKKYLKIDNGTSGNTNKATDDGGISDIDVRLSNYENVNSKFNEGGLIAKLKILICLLLLYYLTAKNNDNSNPKPISNSPSNPSPSPQSSSSSSSSSSPSSQSSSSSSSSSAPRDLPEPKVVHPGIINPKIALKGMVCYDECKYKAINTKNNYEVCKRYLTENVDAGITRLNKTGVSIIKNVASEFFASKGVVDPRRTNNYPSSAEVNFVYDVPEKYCNVEDYSGQEPICVTDTSKSTPATLWFYRGFSLPAIFAVNNALKDEGKGELNPNSTAVQSAGNATSPGGDALMGSGTQEESLQFDSEAYLFINTKRAYEEYYLKNKQGIAEQLEASKKMGLPCSVDAWNKTGIFSRGVYSSGVGLRNDGLCDSNGATINIITTAAADYNFTHDGTYMGPKEDSDGTLTSYRKQLITYWDTILRIAYTNGNRNIVLTTGGGGAYKGDNAEIISALFTVFTQHGPRGGICWARCFDNIIFASGSGHVETNLCKH